jgi:AcrR family transcriptional regulator
VAAQSDELVEPVTGDANGVRSMILNAAVDQFYKFGYSATGVQQIVDAAGRTKGAFYHYWDSKESLLLEIHDTFHRYAISRGRDILAREMPPDEALKEIILELFRQLERYQKHMTVVFHQAIYTPYAKYPASRQLRDEYEQIVRSIIDDGVRTGVFRDDIEKTNVIAYGVMSFSSWATNWYRPDGPMTAEQIGALYARVMIDGLRKQSDRS